MSAVARTAALVVCLAALSTRVRADGFVLTKIADQPGVVGIVSSDDGSGRLFLVELAGRVLILERDQVLATPFLDLRSIVSHASERGLLGLAFHPDYRHNGFIYVDYVDPTGTITLARYRSTADPRVADPTSAEVLLAIPNPGIGNHNGGQIAFGPDGYLYVGVGDGGGVGDPAGHAQSRSTLLGKLLRLDVDGPAPYSIPPGNPWSRGGGRPEIWAIGLRNPWRFSFDRHDLWIADVGQDGWEEVNRSFVRTQAGANYGWNRMEGTHCYGAPGCDRRRLTLPVIEYAHGSRCSVTGGYRYRGAALPALRGAYVFSDLCGRRVYAARLHGRTWTTSELTLAPGLVTTLGEDERGELYLAGFADGVFRLDARP